MWCREDGFRIVYCPDVSMPVSSSEIRQRLAQGMSVAEFVPLPVREYIQHHNLYASPGNAH
jgi:nicotinic acid mononucleotide adenylyltransferase